MSDQMNIEELLVALDQEERKRRKRRRILFGAAFGTTLVSFLVLTIWYWGQMRHGWGRMPAAWELFFTLSLSLGSMIAMPANCLSKSHQRLISELSSIEDLRMVGPLLEALVLPDTEHTKRIFATLTRLLPQLKTSDAALLNSRQRKILYRTLSQDVPFSGETYRQKQTYQLAVLQALEQIGDKEALPYVERTIQNRNNTPAVREAAKACLPLLRERAESTQTSLTLLRAATAESDGSQLLKPASATETDTEQLLRPSQ